MRRCLLAGGLREIDPSKTEWSTTEARKRMFVGAKAEVDMLIMDNQALLPLSVQQSSEVPRERIIPSRLVLVEKHEEVSQTRSVKARLTA